MNRIATALLLVVTWLLLQGKAGVGTIVVAVLAALAISRAWRGMRGTPAPRIRWWPALRLAWRVGVDVVIANLQVARRILGPLGALRSGWIEVPLALSDPHAVSALATIVTMTPGTLSVDLSADRRRLLVHALHVDDPAAAADEIKQRYESMLAEVFR